ncbi:transcriptional regulator, AraC family [Aeromonas sp. RU39B]|nr:transcriptional regulator, AraC family [Aeromonas sp. RU39B]
MAAAANLMSETAIHELIDVGPLCRERICCDALLPALSDGGIWLAGLSDLQGVYRIERRFERVHTFLLTQAGAGEVWGADGWQRLYAGQWALVPACQPLYYRLPADQPQWQLLWVLFHAGTPWDQVALGGRCGCTSQHPQLLHTVENLFAEQQRFADPALSSLLVQQLSLYLHRLLDKGQAARHSEQQWLVLESALRAALAEPWDVARMAGLLHLSERQLHRLCQSQGATTPMGLLSRLRLREAALLLATTCQPHKVIAAHCGFGNEYHFSTAFKRHYGLAPSHYRQKQHPAWR